MSPSKLFKIREIGKVVGGGTPPTSISDYYDGNIPWISPKDLSDYNQRYIKHGARNITELGLSNSSARIIPTGSVLLSSRAPIGYLAIAANNLCTNQGFRSIVPNKDIVSPEYLYYYLKCHIEELKDLGVGTTFAELSGKTLENYTINLPPMEIQMKITSFLSRIDDKIEINRSINDNLGGIIFAS